jgi:hypothetical protein
MQLFLIRMKDNEWPNEIPMLSLRTTGAAKQPDDHSEEHSASLRPLYHPQRVEAARSVHVQIKIFKQIRNY